MRDPYWTSNTNLSSSYTPHPFLHARFSPLDQAIGRRVIICRAYALPSSSRYTSHTPVCGDRLTGSLGDGVSVCMIIQNVLVPKFHPLLSKSSAYGSGNGALNGIFGRRLWCDRSIFVLSVYTQSTCALNVS